MISSRRFGCALLPERLCVQSCVVVFFPSFARVCWRASVPTGYLPAVAFAASMVEGDPAAPSSIHALSQIFRRSASSFSAVGVGPRVGSGCSGPALE